MRTLPIALVAAVAGVISTGCAASGGGPPVMTPAEIDILNARFSGSWVLNEALSDPASDALETEIPERRRDGGNTVPVSTSQAIRPTHRRAGEARDAVAGRLDRAAMRQTILMASSRPERLRVTLSAAGMEVTYDDRDPWMLPADGRRIEVQEELMTARVRLVWEGRLPIIEREVEKGGVVREIFETAANGGTLWVTRQVEMGAEVWAPAQFTFGR